MICQAAFKMIAYQSKEKGLSWFKTGLGLIFVLNYNPQNAIYLAEMKASFNFVLRPLDQFICSMAHKYLDLSERKPMKGPYN